MGMLSLFDAPIVVFGRVPYRGLELTWVALVRREETSLRIPLFPLRKYLPYPTARLHHRGSERFLLLDRQPVSEPPQLRS